MKTLNFSGGFVACDLKVGRYRQYVELMKLHVYSRPSNLSMAKGHIHIKINVYTY